jgi:hypothetical protein
MVQGLLLRLLTLLVLPALAGAAGAAPPSSKVVVLIDSQAPGESDSPGFDAALALAIRNYADYYLYRSGHQSEISVLDPRASFDEHLQGLKLSDYGMIVRLRPLGRMTMRTVTVRDQRRVTHLVKVPSFLDLEIRYEYWSVENGQIVTARRGSAREAARRYWLTHATHGDRRQIDSLVSVTPEPWEQVIQRCLEKALEPMAAAEPAGALARDPLPAVVFIDSAYIAERPGRWQEAYREAHDVASRLFFRDFRRSLDIARMEIINATAAGDSSLAQVYVRLKRRMDVGGDTLAVVMLQNTNPAGYFLGQDYETVGVSDIGQRRIVVSALPPTTRRPSLWEPYFNGLTLLHEIGHAFGAIHVSDINSVMSHSTTWLASDRFDPFNRRIIKAALSDSLTFDDPAAYLAFISKTLSETQYQLVDYPAFLYRFLNHGKNKEMAKELRGAIARQSYITAADAYGYLVAGDRNRSAGLFRQAREVDPDQASLCYYLSKVTDGDESRAALDKAAAMGYFLAVMERGPAVTRPSK